MKGRHIRFTGNQNYVSQKNTNHVIAAFEVEKSTSIYSGILPLTDLSYSIANGDKVFYLVVPDKREKDVCLQLSRPAIKQKNMIIKYILFSKLRSQWMPFAILEKAIIFWKRLQREHNNTQTRFYCVYPFSLFKP